MSAAKRVGIAHFRKQKEQGRKIVMLTAYDAPTAAICHEAGVDMLLVGDSLAMTMLGYRNTLPLTMDEALHHAKAVRRGAPEAFVIGDMPFMSFHVSTEDSLRNAARFLKEADCDAVKLEGGVEVAPLITRMVGCGIPVVAHAGLLPQRVLTSGGYKIQGKTEGDAERLLADVRALEEAGAFAVVVECVPAEVGQRLAEAVSIPVIGIGAGVGCDGQVQVVHDLLGLYGDFVPKHARRYADLGSLMRKAIAEYASDVREKRFPGSENSF